MIPILADTNALIRLLEGDSLALALLDQNTIYISVITYLEMQCKPNQSKHERLRIKVMLDTCQVLQLTEAIQKKAVSVRLTTRMKLPDAIVGASAICLGLPLVSSDDIFGRIKDIPVLLLPPRSVR